MVVVPVVLFCRSRHSPLPTFLSVRSVPFSVTRHFEALLPAFLDERYVKVDGKPLLEIFKPWVIPDSRRAMDYWRRMEVEQRYMEALPPAETTWQPSLEFLLTDVKSLKPIHRACLILRYVHGMTRTEIASRLALSETQVKGHLQYTLTILRRELENTEP